MAATIMIPQLMHAVSLLRGHCGNEPDPDDPAMVRDWETIDRILTAAKDLAPEIIELKPEWRDDPSDRFYVIVEERGDRVLATPLFCDLPIPPQEVIFNEMFNRGESPTTKKGKQWIETHAKISRT